MKYKHNGKDLPLDQPFTLGNKQFPANWLRLATPDDLAREGISYTPPAPKTPAELKAEQERRDSDHATITLARLRAEIFPDLLAFVATLTGAPQSIKDAAVLAAAERTKVKA